MSAPRIDALRAQCGGPRDGALLRFSLGNALLDERNPQAARAELQRAVTFDPAYSAAWKLLGRACLASNDPHAAREAWQQGIAAATTRGDQQAAKEMAVFLRRLERAQDDQGN